MQSYRGIRTPKEILSKLLSRRARMPPRPFEISHFGPASGALLSSKNVKSSVIIVVSAKPT